MASKRKRAWHVHGECFDCMVREEGRDLAEAEIEPMVARIAELEALLAQVVAGRDHAHDRMAEFAAVLRDIRMAPYSGAAWRDCLNRIDAVLGTENPSSQEHV